MTAGWRNIAVLCCLAAPACPAARAADAVPTVVVRKLSAEPRLDGIVAGDAAWDRAERLALDGSTALRLLYGPTGLHVAVVCGEPAVGRIRAEGEDMDPLWREDSIEVLVQPAGRPRPYRAVVNAIGSRYNDPYAGRRGLGRWQARTFTGKDYWSVEIVVPFETLAALPEAKAPWRIEVRRNIRTGETPRAVAMAGGKPAPLRFAGELDAASRRAIEDKIRLARAASPSALAYCRADTGELLLRRGTTPVRLLGIGGAHVAPRLLPGGRGLLLNSTRGGRIGVWRVDLEDGARRRICDGDQVARSPDGQSIVFRRRGAIVRRDLASGDERTVSPPGLPDCAMPGFLPGGAVMFVARGRPDTLMIVRADAKGPEPVLTGEIRSTPRASPDGEWIACPDGAHLWLVDAATKRRRLLTAAGGLQGWPAWSADSAGLCYGQGHDLHRDSLDVYRVKIDEPARVRLVVRGAQPGFDLAGAAPPAGEGEAVAGGSVAWLVARWPISAWPARRLAGGKRGDWGIPAPGGAVLTGGLAARNGAATLVLSKGVDHALLFLGPDGAGGKMAIRPIDRKGAPCGELKAATLRSTPTGASVVEAIFAAPAGGTADVRLTLHGHRAAVEVAPLDGPGGAVVSYGFDAAVVTDRLADDLPVTAGRGGAGEVALPYAPVTHLLGKGSLAMAITPSPGQALRLMTGKAKGRFTGLRVTTPGEPFHLAALTGPGLWRRVTFSPAGGGHAAKWASPHRARWRVTGRRGDAAAAAMVDADTPVKALRLPLAAEEAFVYLHGRTRHTPPGLITPTDLLWDVLGVRAAEELTDVAGVRGDRTGPAPAPLRDPRVTLLVLGWVQGTRRPGVTETVGHLCGDIVDVVAGLDRRIAEYEAMRAKLEPLCGAEAPAGLAGLVAGARRAAAAIERTPTARVKAAGDDLTRVAERRRRIARCREYYRLRDVCERAVEQRRRVIGVYRALAKSVRNRAGLAVTARPELKPACEALRRVAGETLRRRAHLEGDWRGETPLHPPKVTYEKARKL